MKPAVRTASPEIIAVLKNARLEEDGLVLVGELSRDLYVATNKFLETAGAKWNRSRKRHLFTSPESRERIEALVRDGQIVDRKKTFQEFYTPASVAEELVVMAGIRGGHVLEPSAGGGAIARAALKRTPYVDCIEIQPEAAAALERDGIPCQTADFLDLTPHAHYDFVLMNPPFTRGQDMKHVQHALRFLKPGGQLFAIVSPTTMTGTTKAHADFQAIPKLEVLRRLPAGTFREAGTEIETIIVGIER